ncbi:dTDP-4-dehydrorhamnose reductase [Aquimarina sp. RZ0]|uniref:dTDP-4-dehydrorhamnose reductase n=1 Tax=Aquimarina sp. RZ0 TaxID=2607730 RepID=UPI0011F2B132|nr:dTDP-4-dehydrorhamnose reductase [Aquimarina sp. RZ0]KAA1244322.1 dTDP-4-dehydrorhamnose reductase [Aquimarina sp. RZ0]
MKILVTGGNGQLAKCIKIVQNKPSFSTFLFADANELDITNNELIKEYFSRNHFDFIINCAAYTNVDQAEKSPQRAFLVNSEGVKYLAEICKEYKTTLIHISTDYVFDGVKNTPYSEKNNPNPINEYGKSKLTGEQYIQKILENYFIIRTSWLYSQFGNNFYKTILEKSETEKELTITISEIGTPTNANDLAAFIVHIIESESKDYGIYHFSNEGRASWYDFANEILKLSGKLKVIMIKKTDNYPTFAKRPKFSVLSKSLVREKFDIELIDWKKSLFKSINDKNL